MGHKVYQVYLLQVLAGLSLVYSLQQGGVGKSSALKWILRLESKSLKIIQSDKAISLGGRKSILAKCFKQVVMHMLNCFHAPGVAPVSNSVPSILAQQNVSCHPEFKVS